MSIFEHHKERDHVCLAHLHIPAPCTVPGGVLVERGGGKEEITHGHGGIANLVFTIRVDLLRSALGRQSPRSNAGIISLCLYNKLFLYHPE